MPPRIRYCEPQAGRAVLCGWHAPQLFRLNAPMPTISICIVKPRGDPTEHSVIRESHLDSRQGVWHVEPRHTGCRPKEFSHRASKCGNSLANLTTAWHRVRRSKLRHSNAKFK